MQLKARVFGVFFTVKPVGADAAAATNPTPFTDQTPVTKEAGHDLHPVKAECVCLWFDLCQMHALPPHPGSDILFFLAHGIGVDRRGAELGVPHPLLQHVQRDAIHCGVDPEAVAQTLGTTVRCIRYRSLDHDPFDDLPDTHAAQRPNYSYTEDRTLSLGLLPSRDIAAQCPAGQWMLWIAAFAFG